ncbi:peptidase M1 [Desulfuromonas versatilis]|uniref:Peptidase M1 n=1 Tax=Desulfuromonas versatilis TaxID=2802975 RepID=A0ABM8HWE9_9BACT|nr:M1 family aminopeptidase [Desulfuromonas versatilis]BCR05088.1 peptidase M1 [Desulfuromonas versatilis]
MKTPIAALFVLVLLCLSPASATSSSGPEALPAYDLDIRLEPGNGTLQGIATLRIASTQTTTLQLTLAESCRVSAVAVNGGAVPFSFSGGLLNIALPPVNPEGQLRIRIDYQGRFLDHPPEAPLHAEDPTYGVAASIGPAGTFLSGGAAWYPVLPGQTALFKVRVRAPEGYHALTSGRRAEQVAGGESYSVWETNTPLPSLSLAAGPYQVWEEMVDQVPVYAYFYPRSGELAQTYLEATRRYLFMYQKLFGPYPFEKFAVVENFFPTGYGFPSWTLLGSSVVRLPFIVETSLGHEIAHSWWGTGVRADYRQGNWAEGLTTYLADHYFKELSSAEEAREYRINILRDYASLVHPGNEFPLSRFSSRDSKASQSIGYGKAAMVFHMLRMKIGEDDFWSGLRRMAEKFMFREASWKDFASVFGEVSGRDLKGFFEQWVSRRGAPVLKLEGVAAARADQGWLVTGTLVQQGDAYDLEIRLRLETPGGAIDRVITANTSQSPFSITSPEMPDRLIVDPQADLFRRLDPVEIPPTVNAIRGSTNLLVVVAEHLSEQTRQAALDLLAAMRQEAAKTVAEGAVGPGDLAGRDVLFIGPPTNPQIRPPTPEGLAYGPGFFSLEGERYQSAGAALFAALPHPADSSRVTALFLPLSADAAAAAVRKIPHYGKYSYLAFDNGNNRTKGTWPVAAAPTTHLFSEENRP